MNPMEELRAARPAHLDERQVDEQTRAVELARAMARPREPRRGRNRVARPVWGFGLAGAVAAAAAVAIVVSGNTAVPGPGVRHPVATEQTPTEQTPTEQAPTVRLSARDVLLAAAEKAGRQVEGKGDFWHSVTISRNVYVAEDGYRVVDRSSSEQWTPADPKGEQWWRTRSLGVQPMTDADRQAWEAAGKPSEIDVRMPAKDRKNKPGRLTLPTTPRPERFDSSKLVDGHVFWLGRNVTMKDLRGLPDEPEALKKWLMASYAGHGTESTSEEMTGDAWLFRVAMGLIMDMPVTPEVRGAAFRMLADLDEVEVTAGVTDAEGRRGTAVSVRETYPKGGVSDNRLIFDEATGRPLANEHVVVRSGGYQAGLEPGTVWNSNALIEASWTDTLPR
ncbi:CU044_5270 family protein [Nonomuraea salmonea]|uniref:CU044_5270 family protein n=1 Tax=Nonomuraea salmonea TaxID=46181 RepID=A0ABV5NLP7_9ACTN